MLGYNLWLLIGLFFSQIIAMFEVFLQGLGWRPDTVEDDYALIVQFRKECPDNLVRWYFSTLFFSMSQHPLLQVDT